MYHLIDKDALVVEIEKLYNGEIDTYTRNILDRLKSNINTLEVKEVDLEKEINDYGYHYDYVSLADRKELVDFAKHFFELSLKAKKGE